MKMKMSRPWTGKKDTLPDTTKKEVHQERKTKKQIINHLEEEDWEQELKEYKYENKSI